MPPAFASADSPSRPLHVVSQDGLVDWLDRQPETTRNWLSATGFTGALGEVQLLPGAEGLAGAVVGYGTAKSRARGRFPIARAAGALPAGVWHLVADLAQDDRDEAALGWLFAQYRFDRYRPGKPVDVQLKAPEGCDAARLATIAEGEFLTRDLVNTPASDMGPSELEGALLALAARHGAEVSAVRGDELLAQNFPMIHAVGRASERAPRLLDLRWGKVGPKLTLVGKGVCFDTGGLNLKPTAGMHLMKKDMGGAATAMGLAQMIMALGMPVRLRVLIPAVENAVSGRALRPRDILTSRKGLTVEVNDTDAEGRLILGDALAFAQEENPDLLISMATLTGSARVALGPDLAPFYTDDDAIAAALQAAGARVRDPVWRLPFWTPYDPLIEPGIADLDNAPPGSMAGSITAALFLRRFVETRIAEANSASTKRKSAAGKNGAMAAANLASPAPTNPAELATKPITSTTSNCTQRQAQISVGSARRPITAKTSVRASTAMFGIFMNFMSLNDTQIAIGIRKGRNQSAVAGVVASIVSALFQCLQTAHRSLEMLRMRLDGLLQKALSDRDIALLDRRQRQRVEKLRAFGLRHLHDGQVVFPLRTAREH